MRAQPPWLQAWQDWKGQFSQPRVFTDQTRDQISWADPVSQAAAIAAYEKATRYTIPLLFLLGFVLLFLSQHFYRKTESFLQTATHTSGHVVGLRPTDSSSGSTTYAAVVEYRGLDGQTGKFVDPFGSSPPTYHEGETVGVLYSPENPREARIDRGRANQWVPVLLGCLGFLFASLGVWSARRRFRQSSL
jgi:hypothetical protein